MAYRVTLESTTNPNDSVSAIAPTPTEAIARVCDEMGFSTLALTLDATDAGVLVLDSNMPLIRASIARVN